MRISVIRILAPDPNSRTHLHKRAHRHNYETMRRLLTLALDGSHGENCSSFLGHSLDSTLVVLPGRLQVRSVT